MEKSKNRKMVTKMIPNGEWNELLRILKEIRDALETIHDRM